MLNVEHFREVNIYIVGDFKMTVLGKLYERVMLINEIRVAVNKMKSGTASSLYLFPCNRVFAGRWYDSVKFFSETGELMF